MAEPAGEFRRFTAEQEQAIMADDHLLIEAGAGSGKTTTLVAKILHALGAEVVRGRTVARPCELHEIAAITFTNAAAADLKRKLRAELRAVARRTGQRVWLDRAYEVDRARIGTIHSFCGGILRESALRLGLDPGFTVLDEPEAAQLREACAADQLLAALRANDPHAVAVTASFGTSSAASLIASVVAAGAAAADATTAWCDAAGSPDLSRLQERIAALRGAYALDESIGEWHPEHDPAAAELAAAVLQLGARTRRMMLEHMDHHSALDFDALITRTRDALASDASVLAALRARLAWVFIDEFQDTDPAQLEIAYRLCGFGPYPGTAASPGPRLCIVGDPKQSIYRFRRADVTVWGRVVADYRDRGIAPIPLAKNFRSRAPLVGYVNATFGDLIGHGNPAVVQAGHEVSYTSLLAHREAPRDDGLLEVLEVPAEGTANERRAVEATLIAARLRELVDGEEPIYDDDAEPPRFRKPQWRDVALLFRSRRPIAFYEDALRRAGIPCYVTGGDGFFDSRAVRDVQLLLSALVDVHDDIAWLGLLRSPFIGLRDETVLRHRVSHPDAPLSTLLERAGSIGPDAARIRFGARWIAALNALTGRVPVASLIRYAVESSGYTAQALFRGDGDSALANVAKLAHMADAQPETSLADFVSYLEERASARSSESEAPLYTAGEDVVTLTTVHGAKGLEWPIVVLCDLDRDITNESKHTPLLFDREAGIALKATGRSADDDGEVVPAGWQVLHAREQALARAEEKRLWYVAATRARDRLLIALPPTDDGEDVERAASAASDPDDATLVREWLTRALARRDGHFAYSHEGRQWTAGATVLVTPTAAQASTDPAPPSDEDIVVAAPLDERLRGRVGRVPAPLVLPRRSATELMKLDTDPSGHRDSYVFGVPDRRLFARDGRSDTPPGVPARIMGDILHLSLEERLAADDLDMFHERELVTRLGESRSSTRVRSAVSKLRELVRVAREHPAVATLYDAAQSERELPFTWFRHRGDGHTSIVHGAMDLVGIPAVSGPEILDFKSHDLAPGEEHAKAAEYALQRDLYTEALHAITGALPAAFTFFFPATGAPVRHELSTDTSADRLARIDALLARDPSLDA